MIQSYQDISTPLELGTTRLRPKLLRVLVGGLHAKQKCFDIETRHQDLSKERTDLIKVKKHLGSIKEQESRENGRIPTRDNYNPT